MGKTRRAVFASALLFAASATGVSAAETWCDTDPPVVITTPAGNTIVVHLRNGAPAIHAASLARPAVQVSVQSTEGGLATNVDLTVVIADDRFESHYPVTSEVWSVPGRVGTLYAARSGYSGEPLLLQFKLGVP